MAGVKANWHLADLMPDDSDPMDVRTVGKPIELDADVARLRMELRGSLSIENRLYNQGISCELKLQDGWSCRTCPHRTEDVEDPLSRICRMSMRQLEIVDEIDALSRSRDEALAEAIVRAHGDWAVFEAEAVLAAHGDWALADAVGV